MGLIEDGYVHIKSYAYRNERGALIFLHERWERLDPITRQRKKQFPYFDPATRSRRKPWGADALLYRLPELRAGIEAGEVVHTVEGEKDADSLAAIGLVSTTHHQGAGHFHPLQASSICDAHRIRIWTDKDSKHPEVGAYDAWRRFTLLIDAGVDPGRITFWRAPGRWRGAGAIKDVSEMLAAGYSLADAVQIDRDKLRTVAEGYTPYSGRRAGYRG